MEDGFDISKGFLRPPSPRNSLFSSPRTPRGAAKSLTNFRSALLDCHTSIMRQLDREIFELDKARSCFKVVGHAEGMREMKMRGDLRLSNRGVLRALSRPLRGLKESLRGPQGGQQGLECALQGSLRASWAERRAADLGNSET